MARSKTRTEVTMGGKFSVDLATKFGQLSRNQGVSIREALRRLMTNAILENRLPGIDSMELHERRENEKYGAATPTFDGQGQRKNEGGRVAPLPHAE